MVPPEECLFLHSSPLWTSCTGVLSLVWINLRVAEWSQGWYPWYIVRLSERSCWVLTVRLLHPSWSRYFSDCRSFRIPLARCPCSSEVPVLCCTCMTVGKCFFRAHYCPVRAGQPSCVLYTTVINNIFLENVCSFVSLIGGVEVKFKELLDRVLKSVQVRRGFCCIKNRQLLPMGNTTDINNGSANFHLKFAGSPLHC